MSIEDQSTVDFISIDATGVIVLTISDHLDWNNEHLFLLQEKINHYLACLESGDIHEIYPNSEGKEFRICLVCKYEPTASAKHFISKCSAVVVQAGFQFDYEVFAK